MSQQCLVLLQLGEHRIDWVSIDMKAVRMVKENAYNVQRAGMVPYSYREAASQTRSQVMISTVLHIFGAPSCSYSVVGRHVYTPWLCFLPLGLPSECPAFGFLSGVLALNERTGLWTVLIYSVSTLTTAAGVCVLVTANTRHNVESRLCTCDLPGREPRASQSYRSLHKVCRRESILPHWSMKTWLRSGISAHLH